MLMLLLALLDSGAPGAPGAPAAARYHMVNRSTVVVGDGAQTIVMTMSAFVSVTMRDSADGHVAHVAVDSCSFDAGEMTAMLPPQLLESAKGTSLDAFVRNGRMIHVVPSSSVMQTMQLVPAVQLVLVGTRATHAGDSWVDTTHSDTTVAVASAKGTQVTSWTAAASPGGGLDITGAVNGTTSVGGGMMQLEMQMTGTSHVTGSAGELPRSASSSTSGAGTAGAGGGSMAMKLVNEMTVTSIP